MLRRDLLIGAALVLAGCTQAATTAETTTAETPALNTLTAEEQAEGFRLLFDGASTTGWRNFKSDTINPQWQAVNGELALTAPGGGDIVSVDNFENFDLRMEWKISEGGNSGLFYNVVEGPQYDTVYRTGPEMQILDDARHSDGADPKHRAGANYDLQAPSVAAARPVGEWNEVRLVVNHGHVQQYLNGQLVVEYDMWTPEWRAAVAASKFKDMPGYGQAHSGHLALQDHGNLVWFRNMRIKVL